MPKQLVVPPGGLPVYAFRDTPQGPKRVFRGFRVPGEDQVFLRDSRDDEPSRVPLESLVGPELFETHTLIQELAGQHGWSHADALDFVDRMIRSAAETADAINFPHSGPGCPDLSEISDAGPHPSR